MNDLSIHAARRIAATRTQKAANTFALAQKAEVVNQVGGSNGGC